MELKVLGSSSSGNCYLLETDKECLVIEAGIPIIKVKQELNFNIKKVVGCLISHVHNDHSKYIKSMVDCGFHVLALPEVLENKSVSGSRVKAIQVGRGYVLGGFRVVPFPAYHDVPCVGFLINHIACGNIMFLTDSCQCGYSFPDLNHVLVECNYSDSKLIDSINAGLVLPSQRSRLLDSHMELESCKQTLRDNDLSNVMNIVLLHLSSNNSDEPFFVSEVQKLTGKVVYAAKPGLNITLNRI